MTWTAHFEGGPLAGQARALPDENPPTTYDVAVPVEPRPWNTAPDPWPLPDFVRSEYRLAGRPLYERRVAFYRFAEPDPLPEDSIVLHTMVGTPPLSNMEALQESADRVWADIIEAVHGAFALGGPADQWSEGTAADLCWRCDGVAAQSDIGLCNDCRDDLTQETT